MLQEYSTLDRNAQIPICLYRLYVFQYGRFSGDEVAQTRLFDHLRPTSRITCASAATSPVWAASRSAAWHIYWGGAPSDLKIATSGFPLARPWHFRVIGPLYGLLKVHLPDAEAWLGGTP